jgi:cytochrome c oxidase accessory protein FixG
MSDAASAAQSGGNDSVQVISLYVSEKKIYARSVEGWYSNWRWALVWVTQLLFYGVPWLQWNGRQGILFDLVERRFYIGGLLFLPQDFIYFAGLLIVCAYGLFLFTAVAGRLWCGYACPQTVYTEIFTWLERKIEGDRVARMKLDAAPWGFNKVARKASKQVSWLAVGLWTGFTFVGYFTPIRWLSSEVMNLSLGPWEAFWILFYGFATYGNAGYLREQVCKYMCPYARFQSAMFDKDTLIISYDAERGEPRGSRPKSADPRALNKGSCIDCGLCVQVCPTGIDIRKGLQYECIGCAACVDVCDGVMDKMNYPRGLVRYDTQNGLAQHLTPRQRWSRVFRPRVLGYGAIFLLIISGLTFSLITRHQFRVDVLRDRGVMARMVQDGRIENVYRLQIMNSSEAHQTYRITVEGLPGLEVVHRLNIALGPAEMRWVPISLQIPPEQARQAGAGAHPIVFNVTALQAEQAEDTLHEKSTFVVPR